jgi:hypothetical protein
MASQQVLKGTSVTITETFSVDGSPLDLDSGVPTVHAFFPSGTELTPQPVASGSWTGRTTGQYRIVLDAQPEVTILDPITWVGTIGGKTQTLYSRVEWIGAFLFNLADLRAVKVAGALTFQSITDYPNQTLLDRRAEVTDDFEARCGWSFVPRFARQTLDGDGRCDLIVDHLKCSKLLSVTVNGVAQPVGNYTLDRSGVLRATSNYLPSGWFQAGVGNVIVEYVHGWDRAPAAVSSAGLARTAMLLLPSQAGSTVNTWTTPDGVTYSYSQAGQSLSGGGIRHFGVPDIDAVLNEPAYSATGMAFA